MFFVQENFSKNTKVDISKHLGLANGQVKLSILREKASNRLQSLEWIETEKKEKKNVGKGGDLAKNPENAIKSAEKCFLMLETLLGEKDFFMADFPTTLDAVAFGYLSTCNKESLNKPTLSYLLSVKFPKLLEFVERMNKILGASTNKSAGNELDSSYKAFSKSEPKFVIRDEPNTIREFSSNLVELLSPSLKQTFLTPKVSFFNPLSWFHSSPKRHNHEMAATMISPSQFVIGSLFIVLGFISTKRIIFSYPDENVVKLSEPDDVLDAIGSSSDLISGFFDNQGSSSRQKNNQNNEFKRAGSETEIDDDDDDEEDLEELDMEFE
ncbi:hypothetical protein AYI70_g6692 [Smittium culicis]|uniref:Metaxin glutathione S-transferase domain-containing protein n=1 Tax=Smittium culicis TaxID=133412 RepID=A0A1R1X2N2_9FUNG|nr:hypothetical protein AYI70_g11252 [Smittium culicis]OMJ16314.1 hypothetical protein AYI70_g6692 [Smittium culicis]